MSELPMADGSFAELTISLPPTWPAPHGPGFEGPSAIWPYALLQELAWLPHGFATVLGEGHTVPHGDREIRLFAVYPLHADEMELKLAKGVGALYDLLDAADVTETVDVSRPSVAPPKRRGWFRR